MREALGFEAACTTMLRSIFTISGLYAPDALKVGVAGTKVIDCDAETLAPARRHEFFEYLMVMNGVLHHLQNDSTAVIQTYWCGFWSTPGAIRNSMK